MDRWGFESLRGRMKCSLKDCPNETTGDYVVVVEYFAGGKMKLDICKEHWLICKPTNEKYSLSLDDVKEE